MSTINYTYNVIVDRFRQFAAGHFQLRRFTHGEISQADLEKEAEWPWLHVKPRAINYSPGTRSFQFEIFISDLPRDKEDKTGYQAESITDCSLIFQDLINEIYLGNMFGSDVVLTRPVSSEPFVEQYTHTLTGVTGTIELSLDYDWSACSIPASWNYNTPTDSGSDGWGALQFIESLDQNGVFVSLDGDVEAPGNSYYYGTNSSGVKGWYAIVDNVGLTCETLPDCATIISIVDDIAALQTDVALKANTADLGATAFSNDYNDLDNLPSIPSIAGLATVTYVDQQDALKVDKIAGKGLSTNDYTTAEQTKLAGIEAGAEVNVNADWNAVSGDAQILNKPSIPAAQVNSDWNATSGVAQILNKPTIPSIAGLVPDTRTITINGTTQDLSANRTFTIATGLTVGSTAIASGTVGRVLFEGTGNVLQQSGSLFWDNTNNRLGIGTNTFWGSVQQLIVSSATEGRLGVSNTGKQGVYLGRVSNFSQIFAYDYTAVAALPLALNSFGGNVLIGTTTDNGAKLQAKSSGINTDVISILNTSNSSLFRVFNGGGGQAIVDIGGSVFFRSDAALSYINSGGNFAIGTSTDAGYKLDVNGTVRLNGLSSINGAGVANTALAVYGNGNGGGNYLFRMYDASAVERFYLTASGNFRLNGATDTSTTGTDEKWRMVLNFAPTSGTRQHNGIYLTQTINQTGGANGITRGLLIEPTLTAVADFRAIEVTAGTTVLAPSVTARASLRIPSGTAPTSPVNGDIWFDGTNLNVRIAGVTRTIVVL